MTTNRMMAGGRFWRTFAPRSRPKPQGLALLALALIGLVQAGCRSDGCSNCGIGSKISSGVQALTARVTKHFDGCGGGSDCGCGGSETIVDAGVPMAPGGMIMPGPGTIIQSPTLEQPPTQLEAIPSNASPASNRSTPSGTNKSSYTTMAPKGTVAQRRGTDVARALHSSPDGAASTDVFDNLPPVDLPSDVTKNAVSAAKPAPVMPHAAPSATPTSPTANAAAPSAAPAATATTPTPAEKVSAAEGAIGILPTIDPPSAFQAPGVRRFASIAPSVAGGSSPSNEGLDWLKEKGYRTFIDLRKPSEVEPNFVDAVNDRNMVYISLPIVATRLDPSRLARFDDLVAQSDNRPLYFSDTDGTRAALAWYLHLRVVGQEDPTSATGKAEEIGLTETEVKLAEAYIATYKPRPRAATARVASAVLERTETQAVPTPMAPVPPPVAEAPRSALPDGLPSPSPSAPAAPPALSTDPTPSMLPGEHQPQASATPSPGNNRFRDPAFWRPVAALVLTGFGVPLAYWSRSAFNVSRSTRVRASLPGAVQSPSDVPAGSDA